MDQAELALEESNEGGRGGLGGGAAKFDARVGGAGAALVTAGAQGDDEEGGIWVGAGSAIREDRTPSSATT